MIWPTRDSRGWAGTRRLLPALAFITSLACLGLGPALAADPVDPGTYALDVNLAPVCLDGSFPISVETATGTVAGTLDVTTNARGRLSGTVTLDGTEFTIGGSARYRAARDSVTMTLRNGRRNRITLRGTLDGTDFAGTTRGRGAVLRGRNTFSLDVSSAQPTIAVLDASLSAGRRNRMTGTGNVFVCGIGQPVQATAINGRRFTLILRGGGFNFRGSGTSFTGLVSLNWNVRGYGAVKSGVAEPLQLVVPPGSLAYSAPIAEYEAEEVITPNVPVSGAGNFNRFTVDPALPAGIGISIVTGAITGTPAAATPGATYTVTSTNAAGSSSVDLDLTIRLNRGVSFSTETVPPDDGDIRHFLTRTHWGVEDAHYDAVAQGLDAYVDGMLVLQQGTPWEDDAFAELVNSSDPEGLEGGFPSTTDVARWWLQLMYRSETPFQENLAMAWHDHMPVSSNVLGGGERHSMVDYVNLYRYRGTGNFRDLLLDMAKEPAMLAFLDGRDNRRGRANENFCREIWELFSLGRDIGYTQADIEEGSQAFTGYRRRLNETTGQYFTEFDWTRMEEGEKVVFGVTIPAQVRNDQMQDNYDEMVDITLQQRSTEVSEFITRQLFNWYAYPDPPQELVDQMAAVLRANDWEIAPFLKQLFTSEAFYSKRAREAQVKSPLQYAMGLIRATGLEIRNSTLDVALIDLEQRPSQPPGVAGWPEGSLWLSSQQMVYRLNLARDVIIDTTRQRGLGIEVGNLLPADPTAGNVVDSLATRLGVTLTAGDRIDLIDYLNSVREGDGTVVPSPFDASNQSHLDVRVRGVIYVLAQHPTYHTR